MVKKQLCVSALLKRVYWASISKDGMLMSSDKKDITDDFLQCVAGFFDIDVETELIASDGTSVFVTIRKKETTGFVLNQATCAMEPAPKPINAPTNAEPKRAAEMFRELQEVERSMPVPMRCEETKEFDIKKKKK